MKPTILTVDVREDIRNGREPFSKIMSAVATVPEGGTLLLIAPFKPVPLFGVLEGRGFRHQGKEIAPDHWEVRFTRESDPVSTSAATQAKEVGSAGVIDVDARGLEPPEPLVKILEAVAALPSGGQLRAYTDRRPMHLYAQLKERGFTAETVEQSDGSFLTCVRHA